MQTRAPRHAGADALLAQGRSTKRSQASRGCSHRPLTCRQQLITRAQLLHYATAASMGRLSGHQQSGDAGGSGGLDEAGGGSHADPAALCLTETGDT